MNVKEFFETILEVDLLSHGLSLMRAEGEYLILFRDIPLASFSSALIYSQDTFILTDFYMAGTDKPVDFQKVKIIAGFPERVHEFFSNDLIAKYDFYLREITYFTQIF